MKSRDIQEAPGWVSVGCGFLTPEREGFAYSGERRVGARLPAAQTEEVARIKALLDITDGQSIPAALREANGLMGLPGGGTLPAQVDTLLRKIFS